MNTKRVACSISMSVLVMCTAGGNVFAAEADKSGEKPADPKTPPFASDKNSYAGDHLRVYTPVLGFKEMDVGNATEKCAPADSSLKIVHDNGAQLIVRFTDIGTPPAADNTKTAKPPAPETLAQLCAGKGYVVLGTLYEIEKDRLQRYEFKRSGITFGGLVIPFKVRMGGDNAITASSTIAPYVGFNHRRLQFLGLSLSPIVTAGVALVPIAGASDPKAAFSYGFGLVMTSSKNEQFTAGLVIGQDLVSDADRAQDPNARKPWISFYLGVAL